VHRHPGGVGTRDALERWRFVAFGDETVIVSAFRHHHAAVTSRPGLERRAEFVGILLSKVDLVGHSVDSERNRSDVPRRDIAAQVADGRLEAKPARVLSYTDIREAHHIHEAAEAGSLWNQPGLRRTSRMFAD